MKPLAWRLIAAVFGAATGFAIILGQIKMAVRPVFRIEGESRSTF
jgi:hypothetical protein